MDFDLITFAELSKTAGLPATGVGKFDKLKHLSATPLGGFQSYPHAIVGNVPGTP
jgi:hypothetical protein